jgi:hypothetical protein
MEKGNSYWPSHQRSQRLWKSMEVVKKDNRSWMNKLFPSTQTPTPIPSNPTKQQKKYDHLPGLINDREHLTLIVGRKGSGKSHLLCHLLRTQWCSVYDEIIFVSPTFRAQFVGLWSQLAPDGITVYEKLDEAFIESLLKQQSVSRRNTLLILDDCGDDIRKVSPSQINKLVSNSRHYKLSIVCLHQKLTQAPTIVRANTDCFISFPACSFLEREALWKEISTVDRKTFQRIFNEATCTKHSFLVSTIGRDGILRNYRDDFCTLLV